MKASVRTGVVCLLGAVLIAVLLWQALTSNGNPDPTAHGISRGAGIADTAVLVYREGLECILVLSAVIAGLVRTRKVYWKPIAGGAGIGIAATLATWFILVGILALVTTTATENSVQAATGLFAIAVLVVVMNWFFHRIYWTGWISFQNRKKRELIGTMESASADSMDVARSVAYKGLVVLGFASVYREGFEVDIFLQSIRQQAGMETVLFGAGFGAVLIGVTGYFTFLAHQKLPYKKMLVFTGILLGVVFEIMVGEQVNEMQLANWIPTHSLSVQFPAWLGTWFSVFNNWETIVTQIVAAVVVIGSYYAARMDRFKPKATKDTESREMASSTV